MKVHVQYLIKKGITKNHKTPALLKTEINYKVLLKL